MTERKFTDRRTFLKTTGALASAAAIAGCLGGDGGDGEETTTASGGGGGTTTSGSSNKGDASVREEYGLPELDYDVGDTLNVYQWTDYWPSGTVKIFEQAYGVSVNVSNYASNEEMFSKLKAGGTDQFDVVFPSDYMINVMADQGLLQPLDLEKIPHWENLEDRWVNEAPYDPGEERYSSPYQWGTSGIGWNKNVTPDVDATSWDALWNDAYAGQITMLNDMRESLGASLKRLGYSLNTKNEDEINEAKEALIQQKDLVLQYDSVNMAENLINEQASPIHAWSGDAFSAYWELYADGSSPVDYRIPEEGGVVWIDTAAVTKEAKNPNGAHAFINFTLNAKVNAKISNYVYYPTPNAAAKEFIDDAALNNPSIYPPDETMKKLEFIRNLGQATTLYSEAWTEVQNA
ncbi:spermidine/putrescine ABC transporter substrate-binding protein [Halobacteriaceae archaeon GCM10025711]